MSTLNLIHTLSERVDTLTLYQKKNNIRDIDNYEIDIVNRGELDYDIVAKFDKRTYKTTINKDVMDEFSPILKVYPNILKNVLETHIYSEKNNSDFFTMKYDVDKISLSFVLEMNYLKETISIDLYEFIQKTFEHKINDKLEEMNKMLLKYIEDNIPKRYYLHKVDYDVGDDEYMEKFKWELSSQQEKEKFFKLANKYILHDDKFIRIEPLVLEVHNNKCHLYGWYDINSDPIDLPEELNINNRIIYSKHNIKDTRSTINFHLKIIDNKLISYHYYKNLYNQNKDYNYQNLHYFCDIRSEYSNKLKYIWSSINKIRYNLINTHFICDL